MDRPPRKTKAVNYREPKDFDDDDDDDDFASVKAPPSKKPREDVKQQVPKKPSSKSSSQETNSQPTLSQKSRRPLDEKVYERDLEAAITLSLLNNADRINNQSPTSRGDLVIHLPTDENTDPASLRFSNCSVNSAVLGLDDITSEKTLPAPSRQKKAAANTSEEQRKKLMEDDEDYRPKLTPESESDEDFSEPDESEEEEFTVKKVSKTKVLFKKVAKTEKTKSPPAPKKQKPPAKTSKSKSQAAAASTPVRSPPTAKVAAKRPASSCTAPAPKPAVSLSPAGGRIPKWNPPGVIGKSPTSQSSAVKSPGQGLRLGLSRLVRVKPLHPSVASH